MAETAVEPHTRSAPRWRAILIVALLACVVLAVAGWQVVARSYAGASHGGHGPRGCGRGCRRRRQRVPLPDGRGRDLPVCRARAQSWATARAGNRFRWRGPVEWPQSIYPIIAIDAIRQDAAGRDLDPLSPFAPVVINPHETLLVFVTVRIVGDRGTGAPCQKDWTAGMPVRYTVLGIEREQLLPLDPRVAFQAGSECGAT